MSGENNMSESELYRFITLYHKTVYRAAFSVLGNSSDAEDVTQETFVRLYETANDFERDENCKAWLIRVAINLSKNIRRSPRFARTDELDENIPYYDKRERELMECVASLPAKYRAVIHLHYFEGYSAREIAKIIGVSVSTVTTRLARARERLRKMLEDDENDLERRGQRV